MIVTTGGLFLISFKLFINLFVSIEGASSNIGLSKFFNYVLSCIFIYIVVDSSYYFHISRNLIISFDFSAIRFESSELLFVQFLPLITFKFLFLFPFGFFFSFNLARLTEAKLLCFISISSTLSALETVSFYQLI